MGESRAADADRRRHERAAKRDIGEIPAVVDPARRARASESFREFLLAYFPHRFPLPFGPAHDDVIESIQHTVTTGGCSAIALPRGAGKTTIAEVAPLWATMPGLLKFPMLFGPKKEHADSMLDSLKMELELNDLLLEDFPEVCFPIRALEGETRRAAGQTYKGRRTHIGWGSQIVFASIPGAPGAGAVIRTSGITAAFRGARSIRSDGSIVRPDLAILDDLQTRESARSPQQCQEILSTIAQDVAGLAGPGKKIAMVLPCTVIREGDVADTLLDNDRNPQWKGIRRGMLLSWPEDREIWERYGKVRAESMRVHRDARLSNAFYLEHREAMDAGASVSWEGRKGENDLSAIQSAMNLFLDDPEAFMAEYQNQPRRAGDDAGASLLRPADIRARVSHRPQREAPDGRDLLVAHVDVMEAALFYAVAAVDRETLTADVIDYGTWPEQSRAYFTLQDMATTLADLYPGQGVEAQMRSGLEDLIDRLLGVPWPTSAGTELSISRLLVDANYHRSTDQVYDVARLPKYGGRVTPAYGRGITASNKPMSEWQVKPGDRAGNGWIMPAPKNRPIRHVMFDSNWTKSFLASRLSTATGDPGAWLLFGDNPDRHELLADHLTAEYPIQTEGRQRKLDEWKPRVGKPDNHWLDNLVGCVVAALMEGARLPGLPEVKRGRRGERKKISFAERQQKARMR